MLVLGLDPGSHHTGYALVEVGGRGLAALDHGRISCPTKLTVAERLAHLSRELAALVDRWQPDAAALETPFHGLNARSLVVLAQARGALLAVLAERGVGIREYSPAEVKSAVTGNGRADKEQVGRMVRMLLALARAPASSDAADALALAVCFAHRDRMDRLTAAPGRR